MAPVKTRVILPVYEPGISTLGRAACKDCPRAVALAEELFVAPLFCGWETAEVEVNDQRGFEEALSSFSFALMATSPK